jgi:hypothetical protein
VVDSDLTPAGAVPVTAVTPRAATGRYPESVWRWLPYLLVVPALGIAGILIYAFATDGASVFAVALLVGAAAFVAGGLLGFLFGIPRSGVADGVVSADSPQAVVYRSNTNLEQISDWLTKILVGLGLVELGKLVHQISRLVDFLAPSLGGSDSSKSFALAILTLFSVSGFLIFYVATRLYVGLGFARAETMIRRVEKEATTVLRGAEPNLDQRAAGFLEQLPAPPAGQAHGEGGPGAAEPPTAPG